MCKISKVFSINFILIRCGSVPYNYKTENVFAVWHMIGHTTKDFAVCHSMGHTAKLAEAAAAAPTSLPCAGSRGTRQSAPLISFEPHTHHTHSDTHAHHVRLLPPCHPHSRPRQRRRPSSRPRSPVT